MRIPHACFAMGLLLVVITICVGGPVAAEFAPAASGSIKGKVTYGEAIAKIRVTLEGPVKKDEKTDDRGQFEFKDLPPGEYKLEAKGIAKNNRRTGNADVTMPDPPEDVEITIKLQ